MGQDFVSVRLKLLLSFCKREYGEYEGISFSCEEYKGRYRISKGRCWISSAHCWHLCLLLHHPLQTMKPRLVYKLPLHILKNHTLSYPMLITCTSCLSLLSFLFPRDVFFLPCIPEQSLHSVPSLSTFLIPEDPLETYVRIIRKISEVYSDRRMNHTSSLPSFQLFCQASASPLCFSG